MEQFIGSASDGRIKKMGSGQSYGICYEMKDDNLINYMAAYDVRDKELAKDMNLELMEIPDNEYAVVELKGEYQDVFMREKG